MTGLRSITGVGDIIAYIGIDGDQAFIRKLDAVDMQVNKSAQQMNMALNAALIAGAAAFVASVKAAGDFEAQMANVNTLLDKSDENFGKLNEGVLEIARTTPVAMDSLTKGLYDLISAGAPSAKAIDALALASQAATEANAVSSANARLYIYSES